jgi:hypothetical protein
MIYLTQRLSQLFPGRAVAVTRCTAIGETFDVTVGPIGPTMTAPGDPSWACFRYSIDGEESLEDCAQDLAKAVRVELGRFSARAQREVP